MNVFIKEELGRIPGRFVISVVKNEQVVWQREADFCNMAAVKDKAFRLLNSLKDRAILA